MSVQEEGGGGEMVVVVGEGWGLGVNKKKSRCIIQDFFFFPPGVIHGSVFCLLPRLLPLRPHPRELRLFQMFKYNKHGPVFLLQVSVQFFFLLQIPNSINNLGQIFEPRSSKKTKQT